MPEIRDGFEDNYDDYDEDVPVSFVDDLEQPSPARVVRERQARLEAEQLADTVRTLEDILRQPGIISEQRLTPEPPAPPRSRLTRPQRRTASGGSLRPGWMDELRQTRQETPVMPSRFRNTVLNDAAANAAVTVWDYNAPQYGQHITSAFRFFRNNHSGKYTDTTLMRLDRAAAVYNARTGYDQSYLQEHLPHVATAVLPFEYDEETEVKKGGTIGMMATWKDKAILAVGVGYRRMNVGRTLFISTVNAIGVYPAMWVSRTNHEGQHFLLSQGLSPSAMNGNGAIRFDRGSYDD